MSRVLKYKNVSFYDSHKFEVEVVKKLCSQLNVDTIDSCLVNLSLSEKYVDLKKSQLKMDVKMEKAFKNLLRGHLELCKEAI